MDIGKATLCALNGQAILFAGAGFSFGAKNINKESLPNGLKLRDILAEKCGFPNSKNPLGKVADFYEERYSSEELIKVLQEQFSIISHESYHEEIMNLPWKRVYTTNYDRVIEESAIHSKRTAIITPVTLSDEFEQISKKNICIHINGFIERLTPYTLKKEFKLTDSSYGCEDLTGNIWYEYMVNDFESAEAIVVIGYSLEFDIDILRLFSDPSVKSKVVFISAPMTDEMSVSTFKKYGECYSIGVQKYPETIQAENENFTPSLRSVFKSFAFEYREPVQVIPPTYEEVNEIYFKGIITDKLFAKNKLGEYIYLISRKAVDIAMRSYQTKKVLLAISDLGNGKSVFCQLFKNELMKKSVPVYTYNHRFNDIDSEINEICSQHQQCVVIIDDYQGHFDILKKFYFSGSSKVTFVLTARTAVNNMAFRRLNYVLGVAEADIKTLFLNTLQPSEINMLSTVFSTQSLLPETREENGRIYNIEEYVSTICKGSFSNLLLNLFNSSDIKDKLFKIYTSLKTSANSKLKNVSIFCLIQSNSNLDISFSEILDLFDADFSAFRWSDNEFVSELFDFSYGSAKVKSSIIAQEILKWVVDISDIINTMTTAFLEADKHSETTYFELKKSLISHSQFVKFFTNRDSDKQICVMVESFYDKIRNTEFAQKNPFFWEQFASAYLDMKNYPMAKKCLEIALGKAQKIPKFVPFQIETVYGRYYIEKAMFELQFNECNAEDAINAIISATTKMLEYYVHPENNMYFIFKVARNYKDIYENIKPDLSVKYCSMFIEQSTKLLKLMKDFLALHQESPYFNKTNKWHNELTGCVNDAKILLKSLQNS